MTGSTQSTVTTSANVYSLINWRKIIILVDITPKFFLPATWDKCTPVQLINQYIYICLFNK